jgi:endonuclease YncB( thermonuclease family)
MGKNKTFSGKNPNSNASGAKLEKQGKCADRGLWTSFGTPGKWRSVRCPRCGVGG